jgi:hypothetical protein
LSLTVAFRRLGRNKALTLGIFFGILLAATVVAATPIYFRSLERLSVQATMDATAASTLNVQLFSPGLQGDQSAWDDSQLAVEEAIDNWLLPAFRGKRRFDRSQLFIAGLPYRPLGEIGPSPAPPPGQAARGWIQAMVGLQDNVKFVDGQMPGDSVVQGQYGPEIEVAVGTASLQSFDLNVGDVVELAPHFASPVRIYARVVGIFEPTDPENEFWRERADTFLRPSPPEDRTEREVVIDPDERPLPLFTSRAGLLGSLSSAFPGSQIDSSWLIFIDPETLKEWTPDRSLDAIAGFEAELTSGPAASTVLTRIDTLLEQLKRRTLFATLPLVLLVALIVATVLYYLSMMVAHLLQAREREVALLRARGASSFHLLRTYALEAAILATVAFVIAPFLGAGLIAVAGKLSIFGGVTGGDSIPVELAWVSFAAAAGMGIFSLVIYLLPVLWVARKSIEAQRVEGSRPSQAPIFQRLNIDIAVLIIGGLIFFELQSRGSLASGGLFQDVELDETFLLAPILLLVAVALIFLRAFPLVMKFISGESHVLLQMVTVVVVALLGPVMVADKAADGDFTSWLWSGAALIGAAAAYWLAIRAGDSPGLVSRATEVLGMAALLGLAVVYVWLEPLSDGGLLSAPKIALLALVPLHVAFVALRLAVGRAPAWVAVGLRQMARDPLRYSGLMVLLITATGLAVIATTVGATLDRSNLERISHNAVADLRIADIPSVSAQGVSAFRERFADVPDVTSMAVGMRKTGSFGATGRGGQFTILGIDPVTFGQMSWFREDFAEKSLPTLMRGLVAGKQENSLAVPETAANIGVWIKPDKFYSQLFLWAVFREANGQFSKATMGKLGSADWHFVEAEIGDLEYPAELVALQLFEPTFGGGGSSGSLQLDDIQLFGSKGPNPGGENPTVLEDFEGSLKWASIPTSAVAEDSVALVQDEPHSGLRAGLFTFGQDTIAGVRGFFVNPTGGPLPVIMSAAMATDIGASLGSATTISVEGAPVTVVVTDVVEQFPSLGFGSRGFMITDVEALVAHLGILALPHTLEPNELFVSYAPNSHDDVVEALDTLVVGAGSVTTYDRAGELEALERDPLVSAGWRGMVWVALGLGVLSAGLGYATFVIALADRSKGQFAVMRMLGWTKAQLLGLMAVEHVLIIVFGIGLGVWAGLQMSDLLASSVAVTDSGGNTVPPIILTTNWTSLAVTFGILAVVLVLAVAYSHRKVSRALVDSRQF